MKKYLREFGGLLILAILLIALDQLTKCLVQTHLDYGAIWSPWPWLAPYARVIHWTNTGVAFGLFQGKGIIFAILALIVSGAILYYLPSVPKKDWLIRLALILEFSGALGNFIDRVRVGSVIDFISVGTFPVFNVADSCITVGVCVLALGIILQEKREKTAKQLAAEVNSDSDHRDESQP